MSVSAAEFQAYRDDMANRLKMLETHFEQRVAALEGKDQQVLHEMANFRSTAAAAQAVNVNALETLSDATEKALVKLKNSAETSIMDIMQGFQQNEAQLGNVTENAKANFEELEHRLE